MLMAEYLNSQYSLAQNMDFFIRIVVACLCGALIGTERSKRYKEAGVRTHMIVCSAAALLMIVSKYGFADLTDAAGVNFNGIRGADAARIASQVVSGISFLGAGIIFKHGSAVRGLTTAAGLWATAGIGLAIGAGLYPAGIFTTLLVVLLQIVMHKLVVGADSLVSNHLQFTIRGGEDFSRRLEGYIAEHRIQISSSRIDYHDDGFVSYDFVVRLPRNIPIQELVRFLRSCGELRSVGYTPVN